MVTYGPVAQPISHHGRRRGLGVRRFARRVPRRAARRAHAASRRAARSRSAGCRSMLAAHVSRLRSRAVDCADEAAADGRDRPVRAGRRSSRRWTRRATRRRPTATIAQASCWAPTAPAARRPTSTSPRSSAAARPARPALLFNSTVANAAAGLAGLEFKLRGPNATISQKEASGLAAIATAVDLLRAGPGGRRGRGRHGRGLSRSSSGRTIASRVMSAARRSADRTVAPFDRCRRGFVHGRGRLRRCGWSEATAGARAAPAARRRSSASAPRAPRCRSTPGPISPSRWSARCGWRWTRPAWLRPTSTSSMRRPTRRGSSTTPRPAR